MATYNTGTIALAAVERYDIVIEYYDHVGGAIMQLEWLRPSVSTYSVIPQGNLFTA